MSEDKKFVVWNKSGHKVGKGDFIVRKSDGKVMEIESEFPDFFVVSGEYFGLSILNKNTNYSKFYLWTPNAVNVGDVVLTSDETVFVVESIERGESGLKFGSSIFMDDYCHSWHSSCELHFRQEDRWFDANKVRPASSSAIISIASALLNRMERKDTQKPDDGSSSDNKSSELTHYGSYGEKLGFYEFKK